MKRFIIPTFAAALALTALTACHSQRPATDATTSATAVSTKNDIAYTVAQRYFVRNDVKTFSSPLVTSQKVFDALFGMATTMGPDGQPTEIDFARRNVIAVVLPETDVETQIIPVSLTGRDGKAVFRYRVARGTEHRSYTIRPVLLVTADKAATADVTTEEVK